LLGGDHGGYAAEQTYRKTVYEDGNSPPMCGVKVHIPDANEFAVRCNYLNFRVNTRDSLAPLTNPHYLESNRK
jgi:hypothetical protein